MNTLYHFIAYYLAGLALNLTPCVYPMMTVTIALFRPRHDAEDTHALVRRFLRALTYVSGIIVMYTGLGVFAAFTGSLFGGILRHRWVVLVVGLGFFWLGLSLFGWLPLRPPAALLKKLDRLRRAEWLGLFFSGMFVGVFAAPCMGPAVLALLTSVADRGNLWWGFWSFFVFSLGLGTPYLIFGTFSNWLNRLPAAGTWMVWIEHLMGVVLIGFGFYYLFIFLRVQPPVWWVWGYAAAAALALGFIDPSGNNIRGFRRFKQTAGGLLAAAAVFVLVTVVRHETAVSDVTWKPYTDLKVIQAKQRSRPVVIDFYADWCLSCKEIEETLFKNPEIRRLLSRFERLRVDATDMDDPVVQDILKKYDVWGLPVIVFIDAEGRRRDDLRVIGPIPPPEMIEILHEILRMRTS